MKFILLATLTIAVSALPYPGKKNSKKSSKKSSSKSSKSHSIENSGGGNVLRQATAAIVDGYKEETIPEVPGYIDNTVHQPDQVNQDNNEQTDDYQTQGTSPRVPASCTDGYETTVVNEETLSGYTVHLDLELIKTANTQFAPEYDVIHPGDVVCIPSSCYPNRQVAENNQDQCEDILTVVVTGDTLDDIAKEYNLDLEHLSDANPHILDKDLIYPGDQICKPIGCPVYGYTQNQAADDAYGESANSGNGGTEGTEVTTETTEEAPEYTGEVEQTTLEYDEEGADLNNPVSLKSSSSSVTVSLVLASLMFFLL
jgi:LysM repeat protein